MSRTDDDPLFAGILSWWAVLGLGTAVALAAVEPRPLLEELPDAWVRMADARPRARIVRPTLAPVARAEVAPRAVEVRGRPEPRGTKRPAGRTPRILGTTAESKTELVARLFEDDGAGEVDLREASSTSSSADGLRRSGDPEGPAGTDLELGPLGGTSDDVDVGVAVRVRSRTPATAEQAPSAGTRRLPQAQIGGILYCYEKRLMANPDLLGRIEIAFAARPTVVVNDTGDTELASCIDRLARRWTLPEGFDTDATYPVVLRPK